MSSFVMKIIRNAWIIIGFFIFFYRALNSTSTDYWESTYSKSESTTLTNINNQNWLYKKLETLIRWNWHAPRNNLFQIAYNLYCDQIALAQTRVRSLVKTIKQTAHVPFTNIHKHSRTLITVCELNSLYSKDWTFIMQIRTCDSHAVTSHMIVNFRLKWVQKLFFSVFHGFAWSYGEPAPSEHTCEEWFQRVNKLW